ncbi:MAG: phytanoyl-CoA dioxygenase family protein [Armatimonadota bacterium]|nr:phytanoyl-CoA dioxygenase family protein [Armatimonadota bacterium]
MTTKTLMLTAEQRQEWDDKGFFILRGVLSGDILERVLAAAEEVEARKRHERGLGSDDTLEVRNAIVEHETFFELLDYPQTFPLVLDLMGGDIQLSTSHLIVRPPVPDDTPQTYKAINWHADAPQVITYDGRPCAMKVGYFLSDVSKPGSGALLVSPGSHRRTKIERGPDGEVPGEAIFEVNARPGDAVLFQHRTFHAVGPNYSGRHRKVLYFGYNRRWLRPIDYVTMPPEILARFDPPRRQLLGDTVTQCGYYLPRPQDQPLKEWLDKQLSNRDAQDQQDDPYSTADK